MSQILTLLSQSFPPKPKWTADYMPDLTGRVTIVTGGNSGIGKETVKALLEHNAKVYIAARNKEYVEAAIAELKEATGKDALYLPLNLASLASVREAAEEFLSKETELHILFNNAGLMFSPIELLTVDGYDLQFGVNVLGHFFFTKLLMPAILSAVKSSPDRHARIIYTSSLVAYMDVLHWDTLVDGAARTNTMDPSKLYFQSKFGNVVAAVETARRYKDQGIISVAVNPGNIHTERGARAGFMKCMISATIGYSPTLGASTQLWGGTSPDVLELNGEFLVPWARTVRCRKEAYDEKVGSRLWEWLEEQVAHR